MNHKLVISLILIGGFGFGQQSNMESIQILSASAKFDKPRSTLKVDCSILIPHSWHINSDTLEEPYLVPTRIKLMDSTLGYPTQRKYPKPLVKNLLNQELRIFEEKLSFTHYFYLEPTTKFPLNLTLQYQACNDRICLKPKFLDLKVEQRKKELLVVF